MKSTLNYGLDFKSEFQKQQYISRIYDPRRVFKKTLKGLKQDKKKISLRQHQNQGIDTISPIIFYFNFFFLHYFQKINLSTFFPPPLSNCRPNETPIAPLSLFSFTHKISTTQMQDIFGSVRRSLVFRAPPDNEESPVTLVDKISASIRKSRVFSKPSPPPLPSIPKDTAPPIRWRKGELIGCGAFGRVYMGMNLGSGELLAVKQVQFPFHFLLFSGLEFVLVDFPVLIASEFCCWSVILSALACCCF